MGIPTSIQFRLILAGLKSAHSWVGRSYSGYSFLRLFSEPKIKDDFRSVYIASLYNYIVTNNKPDVIIKLFSKKSVITAFTREYNGKINVFTEQLKVEIAINEEFTQFGINIKKEIDLFKAEFEKVTASVVTPTQSYLKKALSPSSIEESVLVQTLQDQVQNQITKQKNTGKYIPNTFIELSREKDHFRFFAHPILFTKRFYESLKRMDFRYLNKKLIEKKVAVFDLELSKIHNEITSLSSLSYRNTVKQIQDHLSEKVAVVKSYKDNSGSLYSFQTKIEDKVEDLNYPAASILLITENAGQGKTNLVCDLAECFLRKSIPSVFVTGYEINSSDIVGSLLLRIFPLKQVTDFSVFLAGIKELCEKVNKPFVIILDGLNENGDPRSLGQSIEEFLKAIIQYDFIKVILTCRTEYFNHNFSYLLSGELRTGIVHISSINERLDEKEKTKLTDAYLDHFGISIKLMSPYVEDILKNNFLLLRVFSEVYKGRQDLEIHDIYKEELYHRYFEIKCEEIAKAQQGEHQKVGASVNIRKFLSSLTAYMVEKDQYANVPLDEILENSDSLQVYAKFLDENILVKRDPIAADNTLFGHREVVNYTFDEFRDYTISRYLLENYYNKDPDLLSEFLNSKFSDKSPILEGCSSFLFYFARKNEDEKLMKILQDQQWYDNTFVYCLFSLDDSDISALDIEEVQRLLGEGKEFDRLVNRLIYFRFNCERYPNLNIQVLFRWLNQTSNEQFMDFLGLFSNNMFSDKMNHEKLIEEMDKLFEDEKEVEHPALHHLFELLIYFFSISDEAQWLFERYHYRYPDKAVEMLRRVGQATSQSVKDLSNNFSNTYDIILE